MADYGREWYRRPGRHSFRGSHGREVSGYDEFTQTSRGGRFRRRARHRAARYGEEPGLEEGFGYGSESEYGAEMAPRPERGYRTQRGYQATPGSETERGYRRGEYGVWSDYGGAQYPEYGYDFEFGGRVWPYQRPPYTGYDRRGRAEASRFGPSGFRRSREGAPLPREGRIYGREFVRHAYERTSPSERYRTHAGRYADEYSIGGRFSGEEFGVISRHGPHPRYGHTPVDRWPDIGHDLDHPDPAELAMSDDEIRENVLENLFQDSWIDPERIDVDVDGGVVTLTGEVRDFMEARYAWDDAWESAGVRGVVNNLTVRADLPRDSMEMPQTSGERQGGGRGRR